MREIAVARLLPIAAAIAATLLLAPTPVPGALAEPVRRAQAAFAGGRADAALEALEAALAFEPGYSGLHALAAQAALDARLPSPALEHITAADAALPEDPFRRCQQGQALLMLGDSLGAEEAWAAGGEACAARPELLLLRAEAALASGERETAVEALRLVASLEPENSEAQSRYGLALAAQDPGRAVEILRVAESIAANGDPRARVVRLAIEDAARRGDPAFTLATAGRALGEIGEWGLAAWAFDEALSLDPQTADARAYLGLALDQSGADGLVHLRRAVEEAPDSPLPNFFLGLHWRARGDAEQALEALTTAGGLDPENPAIAAELAATLEDLGEMDEALAAFLYAADLAPDEAGFWRLLAEFSTRNEIQVARVGLPAARNALALAPEDPAACDALAFAYFLAGDDALARRFIDRAVRLDPLRPSTQYHLGLLLLSEGQIAAARSAFETAELLDPDGPAGTLARRTLEGLPPD